MILALRILFLLILGNMLAVTSWAGLQLPMWAIPSDVGGNPWFIATLFDAYWGFFTFYAWLYYKETSWLSRSLWLLAIIMLGNMAMASYALTVVFRLPLTAKPADVLLRNRPVTPWLPAALIVALLTVSAIAVIT